jgi:hypothetical protein
MKLIISRDQVTAKGLLGGNRGVRFELKTRVELTDEEHEMVKKYGAGAEVLLRKTVKPFWGKEFEVAITIGSLMTEETFRGDNIADIIAYEEGLREACGNFKSYLEVMRAFGGEEVVDYN